MIQQRHVLENLCEEEFALIAIHCNEEDYKLAFLINKNLGLHLKKKDRDLDFIQKNNPTQYPLFEYEDVHKDSSYFLVGNICKTSYQKTTSAGSLFATENEEKTNFLIPEYKKVDYFFKIMSDDFQNEEQLYLAQLLKIPGIITAYTIDYSDLKSKNNLNFD